MIQKENTRFSAIEFFSGIGGLHLSLKNAVSSFNSSSGDLLYSISVDMIKAFEINEHANITYKKRFPETSICNKSIESLNLNDIPYADIWLLSPPCQPFTKGGSKKDSEDPRTKPFLKLIDVMLSLESHNKLPMAWFVENVANFETSNTHREMMNMLSKLNFCIFEFMLSPTMIGIPNTRVRYYCIAVRKDSESMLKLLHELKISIYHKNRQDIASNVLHENSAQENIPTPISIPAEFSNVLCSFPYEYSQIVKIIGSKPSLINDVIINPSELNAETFKTLKQFASNIIKNNPSFKFDIVNINSRVSTTFTKSYIETRGRGGPLFDNSENLQNIQDQDSIMDRDTYSHIFNTSSLECQRFQSAHNNDNLRCFHPDEILSIMGFPSNWFDDLDIHIKKKYSLIGNSISVYTVTILLHFMLELLIN